MEEIKMLAERGLNAPQIANRVAVSAILEVNGGLTGLVGTTTAQLAHLSPEQLNTQVL